MRRPTLTLARLMAAIAALAVGLTALRYASPLWAGFLLCLITGLLLTAVVGVVYEHGPRRAGWLGFGLFAGAYAVVTLGPWTPDLRNRLPSNAFYEALHMTWNPPETPRSSLTFQAMYPDFALGDFRSSGRIRFQAVKAEESAKSDKLPPLSHWWSEVTRTGSADSTCEVGHSLMSILAGLLGLGISRRLHAAEGRAT